MGGGDIFFFKQKTAYEIMPSLVGSEMCIRDSNNYIHQFNGPVYGTALENAVSFNDIEAQANFALILGNEGCLLYTSDAADDMQCVDLGGRRIIKKKKNSLSGNRQGCYIY
ncbi:hypothetical protein CDFC105_64555 [Clostridioides difficile]|nr:hypothetical protein CDFC105_64555 [Clostridioides difficile]